MEVCMSEIFSIFSEKAEYLAIKDNKLSIHTLPFSQKLYCLFASLFGAQGIQAHCKELSQRASEQLTLQTEATDTKAWSLAKEILKLEDNQDSIGSVIENRIAQKIPIEYQQTCRELFQSSTLPLQEIEEHISSINEEPKCLLLLLFQLGNPNFTQIQQLLTSPFFDLHIKDRDGAGILHYAALKGDCALIQELLREYPELDIGVKTTYQATVLHYAAKRGDFTFIQNLLQAYPDKLNINAKTHNHTTLLHFAARGGNFGLIKALTKNYPNEFPIDQRDRLQRTILHHAALKGHFTLIQELLKEYPDKLSVTMGDSSEGNVLHYAALGGQFTLIQKLLEKYPDKLSINMKSPRGDNVLHYAALGGHFACIQQLLKRYPHKLSVDARNSRGETILHYASSREHLDLVDKLVTAYPDQLKLDAKTKKGKTILHIALDDVHTSHVNALLEKYPLTTLLPSFDPEVVQSLSSTKTLAQLCHIPPKIENMINLLDLGKPEQFKAFKKYASLQESREKALIKYLLSQTKCIPQALQENFSLDFHEPFTSRLEYMMTLELEAPKQGTAWRRSFIELLSRHTHNGEKLYKLFWNSYEKHISQGAQAAATQAMLAVIQAGFAQLEKLPPNSPCFRKDLQEEYQAIESFLASENSAIDKLSTFIQTASFAVPIPSELDALIKKYTPGKEKEVSKAYNGALSTNLSPDQAKDTALAEIVHHLTLIPEEFNDSFADEKFQDPIMYTPIRHPIKITTEDNKETNYDQTAVEDRYKVGELDPIRRKIVAIEPNQELQVEIEEKLKECLKKKNPLDLTT